MQAARAGQCGSAPRARGLGGTMKQVAAPSGSSARAARRPGSPCACSCSRAGLQGGARWRGRGRGPSRRCAGNEVREPGAGSEELADDSVFPKSEPLIDTEGAGASFLSPRWLTELGRIWGGDSDVPVVNPPPSDVADLLGGALFQALYKWMLTDGSIYLLPTGPISSFLVVSDPQAAKHILRSSDNERRNAYGKGLVAEVSKFLFGDGFAVAEGKLWTARRRAVGPALHRKYLEAMVERVFAPSALQLNDKLAQLAPGEAVDIEARFSQLTLDVIGKAVFNYDFDSLNKESPVIQAVYTALKETEQRATDLLPYWKVPLLCLLDGRQRKAAEAVRVIRETTERLVEECRRMVEQEQAFASEGEEAEVDDRDPSVLRFLIAARDEVSSEQLRDDLLSMLVAGHETTGSVLTWTAYLLAQNPECAAQAAEEARRVLGGRPAPTLADLKECPYCLRCIHESMRLYPHPPVLIRRALMDDTLPGGQRVPKGQDILLSVYNIHHSAQVWSDPERFDPMRFGPLDGPQPNEINTDFRFVPFSGGPRKCVGDQFALLEAQVALVVLLNRFHVDLVPGQQIEMTTGATIHTKDGLYVTVRERQEEVGAGLLEPQTSEAG